MGMRCWIELCKLGKGVLLTGRDCSSFFEYNTRLVFWGEENVEMMSDEVGCSGWLFILQVCMYLCHFILLCIELLWERSWRQRKIQALYRYCVCIFHLSLIHHFQKYEIFHIVYDYIEKFIILGCEALLISGTALIHQLILRV